MACGGLQRTRTQDSVDNCPDIDDMLALDASEGVKAAPLPDGDLSQAAAQPRPQLHLPPHGSPTALSVRQKHDYPTEKLTLPLE